MYSVMNSMGDLQRCGCAIGGGTGYALWLISCCIPCCGNDKPLLKKFPGIVFICVCIKLRIYSILVCVYFQICIYLYILRSNMYISMYFCMSVKIDVYRKFILIFIVEEFCIFGIIIIVIIFIYYHYIYQI